MKTTKIYFLFLFLCTSGYALAQYYPSRSKSNNELETLEKLNNMMEKDNANELKAKQAVLGYRSEVRAEMRYISKFLTVEEEKELINRENLFWKMATQNLQYSRNYESFYRQNYELLETYKSTMLDYIARLTK